MEVGVVPKVARTKQRRSRGSVSLQQCCLGEGRSDFVLFCRSAYPQIKTLVCAVSLSYVVTMVLSEPWSLPWIQLDPLLDDITSFSGVMATYTAFYITTVKALTS